MARSRHLARLRRRGRVWRSVSYWRSRAVFWAGGALVGLAASALALLADRAQEGFRLVVGISPYLSLLVMPAGFALSAALTRRFVPNAGGSGIPQAIAARGIHDRARRARLVSLRLAFGKSLLTLLGLLCGASVGREGPTVQVGASILHALGRASGRRYQGLILAGSAAGVAAAFNTPLAGIVFGIEEMSRSFEQRTSGLVLTAIIISGLAALALTGNYSYFGHQETALVAARDWLAVPVCGIVGGLLGGLFSRVVVTVARGRTRPLVALRRHPVAFAAGCGLLTALVALASGGTVYGTGYQEARGLLAGGTEVGPVFGLLKFAATLLSAVSGIPGGIFAPSLSVGAGLGGILSPLLPGVPVTAVVLLGMAGYFAGVVQAPITSFVIILEMTNSQAMAIPLMATALIGYGVSRFIGTEAIYHALALAYMPAAPAARHDAAARQDPSARQDLTPSAPPARPGS